MGGVRPSGPQERCSVLHGCLVGLRSRLVNAVRPLTSDELLEDFYRACLSRALDDREMLLQKQSRVFFQISGAGHEALLLGLARSLRPGYDWFFPYYRDRALLLGLGVTPYEMMLQAVGSGEDPASGGRQMPCHWGNRELNIVTQSSCTGSQCLSAVGCAEASQYIRQRPGLPGCPAHGDEVTYVSLGDGATSEGEFWESLNTACTLRLPVLFVVADNGYAISVPLSDQAPAPVSELARGFRGLAIYKVDGRNYVKSRHVGQRAVERIRAGEGPGLIHALVTRPYSHSAADTQSKYRPAEELASEVKHDPILTMEHYLLRHKLLTPDDVEAIRQRAHKEALEAADRALAAARPDPKTVQENIYVLPEIYEPGEPLLQDSTTAVAMGEAIRVTLHEIMRDDERVRVFGQDVADGPETLLDQLEGKGGVFGTTLGLQRAFGRARCFNTPLAEANIVGRAIGQALRGLRPCAEIQFFDYIWTAMQQIKSEAATIRWRSNGTFSCPLVIRAPIGGYLTGGSIWHSQCGESIFAHIPGLLIAFPSNALDAAGLLRTAFLIEDPVLFLEHKHLLRQAYTKAVVPGPDYRIPFGRGRIVRPGRDLTIVTWGATVQKSLSAADDLANHGFLAEVIDLRTIVPWDKELVAESLWRTNKLLVVQEDVLTCGFGAEVAAWVSDNCFADLDGPVRRIGAIDTHVAYEPTLEEYILPQKSDITTAALALAQF
jgi:2-oxoisovalerate dehydrogenase E1 component